MQNHGIGFTADKSFSFTEDGMKVIIGSAQTLSSTVTVNATKSNVTKSTVNAKLDRFNVTRYKWYF